jgi:hypothetical protein
MDAADEDEPPLSPPTKVPQRKRLQKTTARKSLYQAAVAAAGLGDDSPQEAPLQRTGSTSSRPRPGHKAAISDASTAEQQPLSSDASQPPGAADSTANRDSAAAAGAQDRPEVLSPVSDPAPAAGKAAVSSSSAQAMPRRGSNSHLAEPLSSWTPGKGFKKRSEIDRRLDALLFPSGKLRDPSRSNVIKVLRMFNLCDIGPTRKLQVRKRAGAACSVGGVLVPALTESG